MSHESTDPAAGAQATAPEYPPHATPPPPPMNPSDHPCGRALATTRDSVTGLPGWVRTAMYAVSEHGSPAESDSRISSALIVSVVTDRLFSAYTADRDVGNVSWPS